MPHRAVMAAWERSLFGVIPSLWPEPLGSVVYEGMSRGKAVIGTTPGGHTRHDQYRVNGLADTFGRHRCVDTGDVRLIGQPNLRERLGAATQERSRLFTASVAVPQFERFYQRVIRQIHRPNPREMDRQVLDRV